MIPVSYIPQTFHSIQFLRIIDFKELLAANLLQIILRLLEFCFAIIKDSKKQNIWNVKMVSWERRGRKLCYSFYACRYKERIDKNFMLTSVFTFFFMQSVLLLSEILKYLNSN